MDFLLLLYSIILACILLGPFIYFQLSKNSPTENQTIFQKRLERSMLLENLRDLKTDFETGKFSEADFQNLSSDIVMKLQKIDELYPNLLDLSKCVCGEKKISTNSKYCHICGKKF